MPPASLPVPNSTTSFWRSSPHPLDDHQSTPDLPSEADIAIIGAGFSGAATAHHILKLCEIKVAPVPSIVILEARQACSGATGRNGGHCKPDLHNRPSALLASHGVDAASELAAFESRNLKAVKKLVEDENVDCDFVLTRAVEAIMEDSVVDMKKSAIDKLRNAGAEGMDDLYFATGAEAERLTGVRGARGCVTYTSGHLFPYKFIMHLLSKAVEAGVNLQTHTPVTNVAESPDSEGYLVIATSRGQVRAKNIVYATNAYTSALLPEFTDKVVPVRGMCSHIAPGNKPVPHLPNSYAIRWPDRTYEYLIPRLDGSIVVGGAHSTYYHDLDSWYNNVNDDELIDAAKNYFDGYMQRLYSGWEDSDAQTSKVWSGIMGYTSDSCPHVGAVPGRQNQYILAGYTGHGMPQVFLCAKGVASMLIDKASFQSTGIPMTFEASVERLNSTGNVILESWKTAQQEKAAN